MRHPVAILAATLIPVVHAAAQPFDFSFWPGPKSRTDPRFLRMAEMQCGEQVVARVSRVPSAVESQALGTEPAILISPAGAKLREWRLPANSFPLATSGDQLVFLSGEKVFAVRPDGRVRRSSVPTPYDYGKDEPSCILPPELRRGDFVYCRRFNDLQIKKSVILAYVGPCS
jgi:hypothetical protein